MSLLYLKRKDIQNMGVSMARIIDAVDTGLRTKGAGHAQMPPQSTVRPAADAFFHAMPACEEGAELCGMKWMSGYRGNREKGLPYINGLIILSDTSTGVPLAVMDCTEITAIRTGAMVGIAAKHLARPDRTVAGFLGCGVQARKSLIALMEVMPKLAMVRCYDISPKAAEDFVTEMEGDFPLTSFVVCNSAADMAGSSDVIVTATPVVDEPKPNLDADVLKPGALAIALDYDSAWTEDAMNKCDKVFTDDVNQLASTKAQGLHFGGLQDSRWIDLGDVLAGKREGRTSDSDRIICLNLGIAIADVVAARLFYDRAVKHSIGIELPL